MKLQTATLLVAALFAAGCSSARRTEPIAGPIPLEAQARAGEIVFMHTCNGCHPHGDAGVGPALNNKPLPDDAIRLQIRTGAVGAGTMPPFPPEDLSDRQVDEIIAYLKAIRKI